MDPLHKIIPTVVAKNQKIFNKKMIQVETRLKSFQNWSSNYRQKPQELAEAGFYSLGVLDQCVCYYCGLGVFQWAPEDIPWIEHALHSGSCGFLQLKKGDLKFEITQKPKVETSPSKIMVCRIL